MDNEIIKDDIKILKNVYSNLRMSGKRVDELINKNQELDNKTKIEHITRIKDNLIFSMKRINEVKNDLINVINTVTVSGLDEIENYLSNIEEKTGGIKRINKKQTKKQTKKHNKNRTKKHISDPLKGSAAKRINMFLRWMVRSKKKKVDFELWNSINTRQLSCPLDIHTGRVARKLRILKRNQNDFKATLELDYYLRKFNSDDPVKYDFALFGLGVFEKF